MEPLAAFQVLVITMAAAMAVEAVKPDQKAKAVFWTAFIVLSLLGIATNLIAAAWPAASAVMVWIGSSPITFLIVFLAWVAYLQKPWLRPKLGGVDLATLTSDEYDSLSEEVRKQGLSISGLVDLAKEGSAAAQGVHVLMTTELEKVSGELHEIRQRQSAIIDDYQRMLSLGVKIDELGAAFEAFRLDQIQVHSNNTKFFSTQLENIYLAFEALQDRSRLNILESQLNLKVAGLIVQQDSPPFDDTSWKQWEDREDRWRTDVELWCERASKYAPNIREAVFETPERSYRTGDWPEDGTFGSSVRVHAYKTFMIIWKNLGEVRPHVARRIELAAYERQAREMRSGGAA